MRRPRGGERSSKPCAVGARLGGDASLLHQAPPCRHGRSASTLIRLRLQLHGSLPAVQGRNAFQGHGRCAQLAQAAGECQHGLQPLAVCHRTVLSSAQGGSGGGVVQHREVAGRASGVVRHPGWRRRRQIVNGRLHGLVMNRHRSCGAHLVGGQQAPASREVGELGRRRRAGWRAGRLRGRPRRHDGGEDHVQVCVDAPLDLEGELVCDELLGEVPQPQLRLVLASRQSKLHLAQINAELRGE